MYLFFPETNGLHLEEVDQIFRDSKNVFDPPKRAKRVVRHEWGQGVEEKAVSTEYGEKV